MCRRQDSDFLAPFSPALGGKEDNSPCGGLTLFLVLFLKHSLPLSSFQDLHVLFSPLTEGVLLKLAQKRSSLEKDK